VFDNLNEYTFGEIKNIAEQWSASIEAKNKFVENSEGTAEDFWESHHEYDSVVDEYRKISGYLARREHFALKSTCVTASAFPPEYIWLSLY
jgi:hypothetical protein